MNNKNLTKESAKPEIKNNAQASLPEPIHKVAKFLIATKRCKIKYVLRSLETFCRQTI